MWYLNVFSVIAFLYSCLRGNSRDQEMPQAPKNHDLQAARPVPDRETLTGFYDHYVHVPPHESQRVREFVEGFVDDLLAAIRETSGDRADMEVDDFIEVGSLYEAWCTGRTLTCDLWVPVSPREPYSFEAQLSTDQDGHGKSEVRSGYGRVKVREGGRGTANGCPCGQTGSKTTICCAFFIPMRKRKRKRVRSQMP
ncbi:inositol 1,4,5-trisphosphate receptor-interacting protein-like isoform X2 [Alosa alosa]|uniref:inositol 1,4,5-trisphosphate receptor-interacting protein-like isoform X2 n=1 Tax=Alosa alosa TaxID=278164 RepID=UPI0020154B0B|nr:inositol 1,4,5-trisphosphate receptor-interacting protein-like isoform X2 [Alosa alosa]